MKQTWIQIEPGTALLVIGDARITITSAAGAPAPEQWWEAEHVRDRLEAFERLAGRRLDAAPREERNAFARDVLDDGSGSGGALLRRFVRHCQQATPDRWPPEIRLAVLRAIVLRIRGETKTVRCPTSAYQR